MKYGFLLVITLLLIMGLVICYSLHLNKESFVLELVKVVVVASGGGGLGYALGKRKSKHEVGV
jgi:hypothetical protein